MKSRRFSSALEGDSTAMLITGGWPTFNDLSDSGQRIGDLALVQTYPTKSALDLLAKNQGHIAPGVFQQFLASDTNLGAKLQTLQQVNEQTGSHLGRG